MTSIESFKTWLYCSDYEKMVVHDIFITQREKTVYKYFIHTEKNIYMTKYYT